MRKDFDHVSDLLKIVFLFVLSVFEEFGHFSRFSRDASVLFLLSLARRCCTSSNWMKRLDFTSSLFKTAADNLQAVLVPRKDPTYDVGPP